jgi:hypothetical protein
MGIRKTWTVDNGQWTMHHSPPPPPHEARINNHICHYPSVPRSHHHPYKAAWRRKKNIKKVCFMVPEY